MITHSCFPPLVFALCTHVSVVSAGHQVLPDCDPPVPVRAQPVGRRPEVGLDATEAAGGHQGEDEAGGGDQKPDPQRARAGAGL